MTAALAEPGFGYSRPDTRRVVRPLRVGGWQREAPLPHWLGEVMARANGLLMDASRDGSAVQLPAVISAVRLLSRVMSEDTITPLIVPRFNGGLQLEWHAKGVDLEINIDPDGASSAWCEHVSGHEWEDGHDDLRVARVRKELSVLVRD